MANHGTIFCEDCLNFRESKCNPIDYGPPSTIDELCMAPENFKDNHREPDLLPISNPRVINRFNNCVWFIPIEDSSSTSSSSSNGDCSFIVDMP